MKYIVIIAISSILFLSCKTTKESKSELIKGKEVETEINKSLSITGTVAKQGITTYQYGSHTLKIEKGFYALTSKTVNLDDFVGKEITIIGEKIEGYPLSGGPEYIKVIEVK